MGYVNYIELHWGDKKCFYQWNSIGQGEKLYALVLAIKISHPLDFHTLLPGRRLSGCTGSCSTSIPSRPAAKTSAAPTLIFHPLNPGPTLRERFASAETLPSRMIPSAEYGLRPHLVMILLEIIVHKKSSYAPDCMVLHLFSLTSLESCQKDVEVAE